MSITQPSVKHLPREGADRGWLELVPEPGPAVRLTGDRRTDAAVVGAGFTGLAAARRLAELRPDWRIAVVEAGRAGNGASGRSSGFLVDVAYFTTAMEPAAAERHIRLSRWGIDELRTRAREDAIACDWDDTGWLHVAAGPEGLRDLGQLRRWLEERGEAHDWLEAEDLAAVTGSGFYRAGLRLPGRPLVQAAALVRGLARALPAGIELFEESPLGGLRRDVDGWELTCPEGRLRTPRLLLATNGCTPALGALRRTVFPLMTYGSLTRPLTDAERERLGGAPEWGVLAQDPLGSSLRRTRDGRLLVRNTLRYAPRLATGPGEIRRVAVVHRDALERRYPQLGPDLGGIELEHTWAGIMGVTPSRRHAFGRLGEGLWTAAAFTGAGIAIGTTAGACLAELAAGERSRRVEDMLALPGPGRLPPQPFLGLGIRWQVARMNRAADAYL